MPLFRHCHCHRRHITKGFQPLSWFPERLRDVFPLLLHLHTLQRIQRLDSHILGSLRTILESAALPIGVTD